MFMMDCTICLESILETNGRKLVCGHLYHKKCIADWLDTSDACPLCRKTIIDDAPMSMVIARFKHILSEYATAASDEEKTYKLNILYRMISRYSLDYDIRIYNSLIDHGIQI